MSNHSRKNKPNYMDHLHPDEFYEPEMGAPLRTRQQSQFNLSEKVLRKNSDAKMGFVPHILGGKQNLRPFHDAKERKYSVINLNDFPELDREMGYDIFEERKKEVDGCRPLYVGGQVCMQVQNDVYEEQQAIIDQERDAALASAEKYRDYDSERHLHTGSSTTAYW